MINLEVARLAIHNWIKNEIDILAIWSEQGHQRPPRPYASMKIISGPQKKGLDDQRQPSSGVYSVQGSRTMVVSLQIFGADSLSLMQRLQTSTEKFGVCLAFRQKGMAIVSATDIKDISVPLDTSFESRAQMDVKFRLVDVETDDAGYIESVEVTNLVDDSTQIINP